LNLPVLEMLELGSNKIKEIENLEGVASIRSLFLGKNRINVIKNLEPLVHLEQVALGVGLSLSSRTD
jgi:protein phosphatase 1 regulatory subunit 7